MKRSLLNFLLLLLLLFAGCSIETQLTKYVDVRSPITIVADGSGPEVMTPDSAQHKQIVHWIYMNPNSWKKIKNQTYVAFETIKQDHFTLLLNYNYDWCLLNFMNDDNKIVKQYSRSISKEEFRLLIPPLIDEGSIDYFPSGHK